MKCANGIAGIFDNIAVVRDFKSRFKDRKKICFTAFYRMQTTNGVKMNDEN